MPARSTPLWVCWADDAVKRRIIVIVTFLAGLYYVLEFMLPARIGGAPDADGVEAATIVEERGEGQEATADRYIAYTGVRADRRPVILRAALDGSDPRMPIIVPHFARHDDYRGARAPQFVPPDRMYYIGLGWDDRVPRVCLARPADGRWRPLPKAVLSDGKPGDPDSSGIGWASVVNDPNADRPWRMWYVGLQGDRGTVCHADSADGVVWAKRGPIALPGINGTQADCVNAVRTAEGTALWALGHDAGGVRRMLTVLLRADGVTANNVVTDRVALDLPPDASVKDFRIARDQQGLLALVTLTDGNERSRIASMRPPLQFPETRLAMERPSLIAPGPKPTSTILSDIRMQVDDILVVIGAFAVGLGLIGLARVHGKRVISLHKGWPESTAFFVAAIAMAAFTVYSRMHPDAHTWATRGYDLLFYGLFQPLGSSMFSLLACYLVSAAYRAFRVRSFEGALLAASALLIMLGQVPIGNWLTRNLPPFLQIPKVMAWVLFVNNNAVVRAVNFGIFVGALATALRVWLSMDRAAMRSVE